MAEKNIMLQKCAGTKLHSLIPQVKDYEKGLLFVKVTEEYVKLTDFIVYNKDNDGKIRILHDSIDKDNMHPILRILFIYTNWEFSYLYEMTPITREFLLDAIKTLNSTNIDSLMNII